MLQFLRFLAFLVLLVGLPAQAQDQVPGVKLPQSSGKFLGNTGRFGNDAVVLAAADTPDRNLRPQASGAGKRVALVIGNGNYKSPDLTRLANPANDADDIARELQRFGFEVLAHKNLDRRQMKDAIAEFGRRSANAEASLFYFAGHGIQIKNQNYLIPVDAAARSEADIEDEGVNINYPLGEMENAQARLNLVLLDASRNNSFSGKFRSGASRGLAAPGSLPKGTVIVYATEPGNVASDGAGRNGLFTEGFLAGLKGEDLSLDGVLTKASEVVEHKSKGKQAPYINGPKLAQRNFHFIFKDPTTVVVQPQPDPEQEAWALAKRRDTVQSYRAYLSAYPSGVYASAAQVALDGLRASSAPTPALVPTPTTAGNASTSNSVVFSWPVSGSIIDYFDETNNKGIDFSGDRGDPVYAAADGRVVYVGSGLRGYGNLVILKHDKIFLTTYAHNQTLLVKEDQTVRQGQKIAEMGSSDADRIKLNFQVRRSGKPVDTLQYLPAR